MASGCLLDSTFNTFFSQWSKMIELSLVREDYKPGSLWAESWAVGKWENGKGLLYFLYG